MKHYQYWFLGWILDEEKQTAYFCGANVNMLYQYDLKENCVRQLGTFPDMPVSNQLFRGGILYRGRLYFPPRRATRMGIYDIEQRTFRTKDLYAGIDAAKEKLVPNDLGYLSFQWGGKGYFVYRYTPFCVVMNLSDETISYLTCKETGEDLFLGVDYVVSGSCFIVSILGHNQMLFLNMSDGTMELRTFPLAEDESLCSFDMAEDGTLLLLSCRKPTVWSWNVQTDAMERVATLPMAATAYESGYWIRSAKDEIKIFPGLDMQGNNGKAFCVHRNTGQIREIRVFRKYESCIKWSVLSENGQHVYVMAPSGEDIFFSDMLIWVEYDWIEETIVEKKLPLPQGVSESDMALHIKSYQELIRFQYLLDYVPIYTENEYLSLPGWLHGFENYQNNQTGRKERSSIGSAIYRAMMDERGGDEQGYV